MTDRDVTVDNTLMKQIFNDTLPRKISIILQNWDKCVVKVEPYRDSGLDDPACFVRIEAEDKAKHDLAFGMIAAMQQMAATILPELVPRTLRVGKAENAQGRRFSFSVVEFVEGEVVEDVWQEIGANEQVKVVTAITDALRLLHTLRLSDLQAQRNEAADSEIRTRFSQPDMFGGPHSGYLNSGPALLHSVLEQQRLRKQFCTVSLNANQLTVQSSFAELAPKVIDSSEYDEWPRKAVFCHNDLTPRNLILRRIPPDGQYRLVGIIDWELAGFYPASYELSLQDTRLAGANRHLSFYLLLKKHMSDIVPRSSSQIKLLEAVELIYESQQKSLFAGTNIPAHIRARFIRNLHLIRNADPYLGWTRDPNDSTSSKREFSKTEAQELEDSVVEEMLARRKSKAKKSKQIFPS